MRYFGILMLVFIFLSCGGGSSSKQPDRSSLDKNEQINKNVKDKYFYKQWYLAKNKNFYKENDVDDEASLHGGLFYEKYQGKGVRIAIIDNGLDALHVDLKGAIEKTYSILHSNEDVSLECTYLNNCYHGTAVTGLIGARANNIGILGLASGSKLAFFQHTEYMSDEQTIELFRMAVEDFGADVINCSWGTNDVGQSVKEYIQDISANGRNGRGVVVVFAVGNDGGVINKDDESSIPEVISVGSSTQKNERALYSNYGKTLDVIAPGGTYDFGMISLDIMGYEGDSFGDYADISGTSASAPLVSGVVAMMLEANPNLKSWEVQEILKNSADKIGDIGYEDGFNAWYGYGKVNIQKAIKMSLSF